MSGYDAIVVGAGHNGLVAAATLAKAGRKVAVLERADAVGGAARTVHLAPGLRCPQLAHLLFNLSPAVVQELDLAAHGLELAATDLPTVALAPEGRHVVVSSGRAGFADGKPHPDGAAFAALRERLARYAGVLAPMLLAPPPRLGEGGWREAPALGRLALRLRLLGKPDMREFLRLLLCNAADAIGDEIADGPLAGALGVDAVLGGHVGPRSPGTVLTLMYRLAHGGSLSLPKGGMGALAAAFARAATAAGAEIRTGAAVARILVERDTAAGVVLASGETLRAPVVLCGADAATLLRLAGPAQFDAEMVRRIRQIRAKGTTAKVNLALSELPGFLGLDPAQLRGRVLLAPSLRYVERAFDPAKYGEMSPAPVLDLTIPTLADPSLADQGGHVLSVVMQYAPHALHGGWTDEAKERLAETVLTALEPYAPGLRRLVSARQVLAPTDIERLTGATGGHWHHGELAVDQMLMLRPVNGMGHYATGIGGLFLCGAAAHPGGDVMGLAGRNAALAALNGGGHG
ncbi:MAG: NAD(P)/FAD-dependent oxidoreductase [Geminicoccaceae bacterium]